jgi:hypothetical protein
MQRMALQESCMVIRINEPNEYHSREGLSKPKAREKGARKAGK